MNSLSIVARAVLMESNLREGLPPADFDDVAPGRMEKIKAAAKKAGMSAVEFLKKHKGTIGKGAVAAGALGSAAYLYKKRHAQAAAERAAKEAYYATYMSLMEADEPPPQPEGFARKWGRRALKAGAGLGGAYLLAHGARGAGMALGVKGAKASDAVSGALGDMKKAIMNPINSNKAAYAHLVRKVKAFRGAPNEVGGMDVHNGAGI